MFHQLGYEARFCITRLIDVSDELPRAISLDNLTTSYEAAESLPYSTATFAAIPASL
jgi:hypothetical protein